MKNKKTTETPNFENPAEAARAWAAEYEARIAAEKERDKAKTERGQISSRREATALARTMLANREVSKLKASIADLTDLGELAGVSYTNFATVLEVENVLNEAFDNFELRRYCNKHKTPPIYAEDGETYAWPASAWKAVFGVDILALREDGVLG